MKNILAFETSCDETSVALVTTEYQILAHTIATQMEHARFGGVVPEIAGRLHLQMITPLVDQVLREARMGREQVDYLAVSVNPGLIGALLVGVSFAKALAWAWSKPLVAVNHMLAHIWANKLVNPALQPPFLALVVSGGHTELVHFKEGGDIEVVGRTQDDAAGEAFDKTAKLLGLGYPGGPVVDKLAQRGKPDFVDFPRALREKENYNFSFSGLKTAVKQYVEQHDPEFIKENAPNIAASLQAAVTDVLIKKSVRYARTHHINRLVLAGGVAANSGLRTGLDRQAARYGLELFIPPLRLCTDNAAMVGAAAVEKVNAGDFADLSLNAFSQKGTRRI